MEKVDRNIHYWKMQLIGIYHNPCISLIRKADRELMNWKVIKRILIHANRN